MYKVIISEKIVEISGCWEQCPYYGKTMDGMECNHPFFDDKPAYANGIIGWDQDIKNDVPAKCPLRTTINQLKLG